MTTIKLRRGLSTAFSTNNPVLAAGEPAFATDTGILKIGDGTTAYNSLPSIGASPDLSNYVTTNTAQTISAAKTFTQTSGAPLLQGTNGDGGYKVGFNGTSSNRAGMMVYNSSGQAGYSIGSNSNSDVFTAAARFISNTSGQAQIYASNQLVLFGSASKFIKINSSGAFIGDTDKILDSSCVDGATITYNSTTGKISAAGSAPSNMVTTDTQQTISGIKTWTGQQYINGGVEFGYTYTNRSRGAFNFGAGSSNQPNAVISPNGYIDLTGYGNATTNNIRLDYYTANTLTIRRQVASGTIDNGVFNVWSGNTEAASSTKFKVDNTGVTVNGSIVLTESTGVKSSDIRNIVKLTQTAYDNLATKDANTFYVIIPASS